MTEFEDLPQWIQDCWTADYQGSSQWGREAEKLLDKIKNLEEENDKLRGLV